MILLLGLRDRYYENGGTDKGFQDDIMGKRGSTNIHDFHYRRYISTMYETYPCIGLPDSDKPRLIRKIIDVNYQGVRLQPNLNSKKKVK